MKRLILLSLLSVFLIFGLVNIGSENLDSPREPVSILLNDCIQVEYGKYELFPFGANDTTVLSEQSVSLWMDPSYIIEMNDGEYQFNKLQIKMAGDIITIDSVLQYGKPHIMNNSAVLIIPIMTMQNFDLTFVGKILFVSLATHNVDFELFQRNSMACCTNGDKFYFVSSDSLFCFIPQNHQIDPIFLFEKYSPQSVSVCLESIDTKQMNLVYYENIEESILSQGTGRKVRLPLVN